MHYVATLQTSHDVRHGLQIKPSAKNSVSHYSSHCKVSPLNIDSFGQAHSKGLFAFNKKGSNHVQTPSSGVAFGL